MTSAVHASVRRSASGIQAPSAENLDDAIVAGGKLYFEGCAGCHGQPGKAEQDLSHYPPVPQLWQVSTKYSEPEIYWIIQHGIRHTAMSAYGPFYSDKQLWALASFVRRIDNFPAGLMERIQAKTPPANPRTEMKGRHLKDGEAESQGVHHVSWDGDTGPGTRHKSQER